MKTLLEAKAKVKRQKAKIRNEILHFLLLPFYFYLVLCGINRKELRRR
jgi:hypothetical protein